MQSNAGNLHHTCLPVEVAVELVDCGGDLQSGLQHHLLSLETDVLWPPGRELDIKTSL